jgi:UDP-N-acetylmuramoyl-L-alanyl-D-glutamate--2,6-diaminopimelate ligase
MLNNVDLEKILGNQVSLHSINDIHWRTQDSSEDSILFYKLGETKKDEAIFLERIKLTRYGHLVLNRKIEQELVHSSVISEELWPSIQKVILDKLYPLPDIKLIGVTGTNGKTTTADLVLQLGELIGKKGMSIGTLGVRENGRTMIDFGLTSPSFIDLRKYIHRYGQGKDFCVMEASSHALYQQRIFGIEFDAAGWLSFSQDHLDYHQTMKQYFEAKCLIFRQLKKKATLIVPSEQKDLFEKLSNVSNQVKKAALISVSLPVFFKTQFNKNNLEVAQAIIEDVFSIKLENSYDQLLPPDGRFYIRPYKSNFIVVDFAHTPDALENICQGILETFPKFRLKILFGCGGDRDRTKRPLMGKIAAKYAEKIYITSDNPRSENPDQIIADITQGIDSLKLKTITDRREAVKIAFSELNNNEILLLAGKGHEDYILINGVKHPYSDIREVDEFISRNNS